MNLHLDEEEEEEDIEESSVLFRSREEFLNKLTTKRLLEKDYDIIPQSWLPQEYKKDKCFDHASFHHFWEVQMKQKKMNPVVLMRKMNDFLFISAMDTKKSMHIILFDHQLKTIITEPIDIGYGKTLFEGYMVPDYWNDEKKTEEMTEDSNGFAEVVVPDPQPDEDAPQPEGAPKKKTSAKTKFFNAFDFWRKCRDKRKVNQIVYAPSLGGGFRHSNNSHRSFGDAKNSFDYFNKWPGFPFCRQRPVQTRSFDDAQDKFMILTHHIESVLCRDDPRLYHFFLSWMAHIRCEPGKLTQVVPLFFGAEGAGKSLLMQALCKVLGKNALQIQDANHVNSRFFSSLADNKIFIFLDELCCNKNFDLTKFKSLVTMEERHYEQKCVNARQVPNTLNFAAASNRTDSQLPVDFETSNRRFLDVEVSGDHVGNKKYFHDFISYFIEPQTNDDSGLIIFDRFLMSIYYSKLFPYEATEKPMTAELQIQKYAHMDPFSSWWGECLLNEFHPGNNDLRFVDNRDSKFEHLFDPKHKTWVLLARLQLLHLDFKSVSGKKTNMMQFMNKLAAVVPSSFSSAMRSRPSSFSLPPLDQCREAFNKKYKFEPDLLTVRTASSDSDANSVTTKRKKQFEDYSLKKRKRWTLQDPSK